MKTKIYKKGMNMKTIIAALLFVSFTHAQVDTLVNKMIYSGATNQIRIHLGESCSPCALYWWNDNQALRPINRQFYGAAGDTIKIQYDFIGGASVNNKLYLYAGSAMRSVMPFFMDYPIPEAILNKKRQIVQVQLHKTRYLVSGRPWARGGWRVGK